MTYKRTMFPVETVSTLCVQITYRAEGKGHRDDRPTSIVQPESACAGPRRLLDRKKDKEVGDGDH